MRHTCAFLLFLILSSAAVAQREYPRAGTVDRDATNFRRPILGRQLKVQQRISFSPLTRPGRSISLRRVGISAMAAGLAVLGLVSESEASPCWRRGLSS